MIGAFRRLLLAAGDGAPVVLFVDDAHLADEATIDVLDHLGSAGGTLLAVLAYRPEAAPEAADPRIGEAGAGGQGRGARPRAARPRRCGRLGGGGSVDARAAEVVDRIIDLAKGNPFLMLELARSAVAGVPALVATARDAIASRFLDLDEGRRRS